MTKVAIFGGNNPVKFKNEINDFIKDKKIIDIKYNTVFYSGLLAGESPIVERALVIYEE